MAFQNGLGQDLLGAVVAVTGAAAAKGANPVADINSAILLNKVVSDLVTVKNNAVAEDNTPKTALPANQG